MNLLNSLFNSPCVVGLVANINEGKSNLIYYLITELIKAGNKNVVSFGLRLDLGEYKIHSLRELEECRNQIIFLDEMMTLFDLDNRSAKRQIENTLRLIAHNNNVLVLCGLPENFKKFLCGKVTKWIFKKVTIEDFIRGSGAKKIVVDYKGEERGTEILNLMKDEALFYVTHYAKIKIPYLKQFDTKANNVKLLKDSSCNSFRKVSVNENVGVSVSQNVSKCNEKGGENDT